MVKKVCHFAIGHQQITISVFYRVEMYETKFSKINCVTLKTLTFLKTHTSCSSESKHFLRQKTGEKLMYRFNETVM